MKPFWCFYGGKWRAAPKYPRPIYDTIIEPFAGAAGYATRYYDRKVILVEKDPRIAALWKFLIGASREDILAIPLIGPDQTVDDLHVCQEAMDLVGFWINQGSTSPRKRPSAWMNGIKRKFHWGEERRTRIATQVDKIKHWKCIDGSYEMAPRFQATYYVDPPYKLAGKHYKCGSKSIDYASLSAWCRSLPGQVMVCENAEAEWLPFLEFGNIKSNGSARGKKISKEVLFTQLNGTQIDHRCDLLEKFTWSESAACALRTMRTSTSA